MISNKLNPKNLFLIDGLGAGVSALMLGFVLAAFEATFGMPAPVLYLLAALAGIFCLYSLLCALSKAQNWRPYIKIIAGANLLYCCLTLGLMLFFYQKLTGLGFAYFAAEILVILVLAVLELKTASNAPHRQISGP